MKATSGEIQTPNPNEYRKDIYMININPNIMEKINKKEDLTYKEIIKIPNTGSDNYFFKCISQFFNNSELYHIYYRKKYVI